MLKPLRLAAFAVSVVLCLVSTGHAGCNIPANTDGLQKELLADLNAERRAAGLRPLTLSAKLEKAAQGHACDNANRRSISHDSSDGGTLKTRLRKVGYRFRAAAENTGRGFGTPARAVDWWMHSPHHRANILFPKMREVGIGIALSDAPDNKLHWVLNFGVSQ
jgi:uncharacterized protein YkwD